MSELIQWLLDSDEPWTRYRTRVDLLGEPTDAPAVEAARAEMVAHPQVQELVAETTTWGNRALKRHSDASHPIYAFATLADLGVKATDPGMAAGIESALAHQSAQGAFETVVNLPKRFGGTGEDAWTWMACDAPTLLYALLAMGLAEDERVRNAVDHLESLVEENGWHCCAAPELGAQFRGPGRSSDPCPMANVCALKALSEVPDKLDSPAARTGAEMLLWHWEHRTERKLYLFGIGTDYRKLKYPLVWYNVLHVVGVLSRYPHVYSDPRFRQMVGAITSQADERGRYTAGSMYRAWKGWTFADKAHPSPWLTFVVLRILKSIEGQKPEGTDRHERA
jgi:hypothetical protein